MEVMEVQVFEAVDGPDDSAKAEVAFVIQARTNSWKHWPGSLCVACHVAASARLCLWKARGRRGSA